jgi:hypothetical protein
MTGAGYEGNYYFTNPNSGGTMQDLIERLTAAQEMISQILERL